MKKLEKRKEDFFWKFMKEIFNFWSLFKLLRDEKNGTFFHNVEWTIFFILIMKLKR